MKALVGNVGVSTRLPETWGHLSRKVELILAIPATMHPASPLWLSAHYAEVPVGAMSHCYSRWTEMVHGARTVQVHLVLSFVTFWVEAPYVKCWFIQEYLCVYMVGDKGVG